MTQKKRTVRKPKAATERLTLTRWSQKKLVANKYKFLHTTFVTRDGGPTKGTIWFDKSNPKTPPRYVSEVMTVGKIKVVLYTNGVHEPLQRFLDMCDIGQYILIGVLPSSISHTEI